MSRLSRQNRKAKRQAKKVVRKAKRKEIGAKVKKAVKRTIKKAKDVGGVAILIPFKALMQKTLRAKGINPSNNLTDLAKQFFQYIVRRNSYDEVKYLTNGTGMAIDTEFENLHGIDVTRDSVDPVTMTAIISAVVKYVKGVIDKKKKGDPMTPTQKKVADLGEEINEKYDDAKSDAVSSEVGDIVTQYWWVGAILLVLLVLRK